MNDPQISEPKRSHSVHATRLVHEYYGTLMSFAYSRPALERLAKEKFGGEWKNLHRALFDIPDERAIRALIELGLYIRMIDDDEQFSKRFEGVAFGELFGLDGSREPLKMREVANKIIHCERYQWNFAADSNPFVICHAHKGQAARGYAWATASISLVALGFICGMMTS
jgi:hypothetical protein